MQFQLTERIMFGPGGCSRLILGLEQQDGSAIRFERRGDGPIKIEVSVDTTNHRAVSVGELSPGDAKKLARFLLGKAGDSHLTDTQVAKIAGALCDAVASGDGIPSGGLANLRRNLVEQIDELNLLRAARPDSPPPKSTYATDADCSDIAALLDRQRLIALGHEMRAWRNSWDGVYRSFCDLDATPPPMVASKVHLDATFTEWERRYREEPRRFMSPPEQFAESAASYGQLCAAFFTEILSEVQAGLITAPAADPTPESSSGATEAPAASPIGGGTLLAGVAVPAFAGGVIHTSQLSAELISTDAFRT